MIRIGVCADDFGLTPGINDGVIELVAAGRLSATACMSRAPHWRSGAARIRDMDVDLGLHLSLTEPGASDWYRPLPALILTSVAGLLSEKRLRLEIKTQLDAFEDACGRAPDFIDGHQHVHQLPGVRDALMQEITERYAAQRPWLRNTRPPQDRPRGAPDAGKQRFIASLGAKALTRMAAVLGLRQNRDLLGVYGFEGGAASYRERLATWLNEADEGSLLMCHPARGAPEASDAIGTARAWEQDVLGGADFAAMLAERGVEVRRLSVVLAG